MPQLFGTGTKLWRRDVTNNPSRQRQEVEARAFEHPSSLSSDSIHFIALG